jgi:hypothetical protein
MITKHVSILLVVAVTLISAPTSSALTISRPERRGPNNSNPPHGSPLGMLPNAARHNLMLQNCATSIGSGNLDLVSPLCRAWILSIIRSRNEEAHRLTEMTTIPEEPPRGIHEMKVMNRTDECYRL